MLAGNLCSSFLHCYDKWSKCYYFKQDWRSRAKAEIVQYVILKCTSTLLIGLGTSLVAFFNNIELKVCAYWYISLVILLAHKVLVISALGWYFFLSKLANARWLDSMICMWCYFVVVTVMKLCVRGLRIDLCRPLKY